MTSLDTWFVEAMLRVLQNQKGVLDRLSTAHYCEPTDQGRPEDCSFGGQGCYTKEQIRKDLYGERG